MSYISNIDIRPDSAHLDAFQRLRVSDPTGLFHTSFEYNKLPTLYEEVTSGTGSATHLPNESSVQLSTGGTANAAEATLQSRRYIRYQPGKSQLILMTWSMGDPYSNAIAEVGLMDDNNGLFFRRSGSDLQFVRRSYASGAAVDDAIDQADWNIDKMDGTGVSGITIDPTKAQITVMDIEWLGVGRVRMGFVVDGKIYMAHQFLNTNASLSTVYMTTANLPLRWTVRNSGTAGGTLTMRAICASVSSEGGFDQEGGFDFGRGFQATTAVGAGAEVLLFGLRPRTTFNGIVNRVSMLPEYMTLASSGSAIVYLLYNPTFAGGAWSNHDATYSAAEYMSTLGTVTGGIRVAFGYVTTSGGRGEFHGEIGAKWPMVLDAAGANPRGYAIVAQSLSGNINMNAGLGWKEQR